MLLQKPGISFKHNTIFQQYCLLTLYSQFKSDAQIKQNSEQNMPPYFFIYD